MRDIVIIWYFYITNVNRSFISKNSVFTHTIIKCFGRILAGKSANFNVKKFAT
jgi:hypothetical protein